MRTKTARRVTSARRRRRRPLLHATLISVAFLAFAAAMAAGFIYVRLLHGGISLRFATGLIEQTISADLGGRPVRIEDVEVLLGEGGRLQFSLRNVVVNDVDGAPLAVAPRASAALSRSALYRGRLAISRIDLVAPRLLLFYADTGALSLRIARAAEPAVTPIGEANRPEAAPATRAPPGPQPASPDNRGIDLVKVLAEASARARRREDSAAFLRVIGVKQAVVIVDNGVRKSVWNVPEAQLDLDHKRTRSLIAGRATVASLTGPWTIAFDTFEAEQSEVLQLGVAVRDVNPHGLARMAPSFALFEGLDVKISADAKIELPTSGGGIKAATFELSSGAGTARLPLTRSAPLDITKVALTGSYDGARRHVTIGRAMIATGEGRIGLNGRITGTPGAAAHGEAWQFDLASVADAAAPGQIGAGQLVARGSLRPSAARLVLNELVYRVAGADLAMKGEVADLGGQPRAAFEGRVGPMSIAQIRAAWPAAIAPAARAWVAGHVTKGQIAGGTFKVTSQGGPSRADPNGDVETRVSAAIEAGNVELSMGKGQPVAEVPRALLRVEGRTIEVTAPDAAIAGSDQKKLQFKAVRFTAVEAVAGDQTTAEVAFRVQGPLSTAVELADREPLQALKSNGIAVAGLDGKIDGTVKVTMPLADNVQFSEMKLEGKLRASDLRMKAAIGGFDLNGGSVAVDLSEKLADIRGDLLVRGVNAKLAWPYALNAPAERQQPLRITSALDTSDRAQLGLDVADVVQGETPLEILVSRDARGELQTRVKVDLTKSEVTLDAIDWKKPAGRAAVLTFEPAKGPGTGAAQRTELQNVKLVGDDVAIEGWMAIGADNKLREMSFPHFSVNTITRLDVQGKLRADNVWDVRAKGPTFDARDMFRGLFNLQPKVLPKDKPGLDLVAEIDTALGFSDTSLKNVRLRMSRRAERLTDLDLKGTLEGGRPFLATLVNAPQGRQLRAQGEDAGQVFKLVGFYPNAVGGRMQLEVNLDAKGVNEKTGTLWAENFAVLGDAVVSEVLQNADGASGGGASGRRVVRSKFDFDWLRIPFAVGSGQFVMNDAAIKGPLIGATWRGNVDFKSRNLIIGGTYAPLSGLNSALGAILGPITGGAQGEGLLGITFKIEGQLANPQVTVNPFSLVAPGIFREIFQMTPETYKITPRVETPAAKAARTAPASPAARASSAAPAAERKPAPPRGAAPGAVSDWSSVTKSSNRAP